jgi:hypothetical protein
LFDVAFVHGSFLCDLPPKGDGSFAGMVGRGADFRKIPTGRASEREKTVRHKANLAPMKKIHDQIWFITGISRGLGCELAFVATDIWVNRRLRSNEQDGH